MKNKENVTLGIILVIVGLIMCAKTLHIIDINIFFKGWWTLLIIIPSLIGLINGKDKNDSLIGLVIGVLLLLSCYNIVSLKLILKLIFPIIIIALGLSLIFKNMYDKKTDNKIKEINHKKGDKENYYVSFSKKDISLNDEIFNGAEMNAIFGSIKLDLRKANIKEDIVIDASSIFGSIDIIVPKDMKVKVKSTSFFGGITNEKETKNEEGNIIYVDATCLFGGVNIK